VSGELAGRVTSLWRHPVKGFTPERLSEVVLTEGAHFPGDRMFAIEDGPSGFDPAAPVHISKTRFTVLARLPKVAAIRTRYDEATGVLTASHPDFGDVQAQMNEAEGRDALAAWVAQVLGEDARGTLKVLPAPDGHRFMDSRSGFVSIINLASLRDLEARTGRAIDPLRFRGNILVDGWPAWSEHMLAGKTVTLGGAALKGIKPVTRCAATHVDPVTAEADMNLTAALYQNYGHTDCGLYAEVMAGGRISPGDEAGA
jgi:uncharacterized protein YcbX